MSSNLAEMFGRYFGRLALEPLPDGRKMQLTEPFGFITAGGQEWPVPIGAIVDGASIPRVLWSLAGGPFDGKYRVASVIHDYYCDVRSRPWKAVHRVFYDGMRASDVSETRAKVMYAAVYFLGPHWSDTVVKNTSLQFYRPPDHISFLYAGTGRGEAVNYDVVDKLLQAFDIDGNTMLEFYKLTNRPEKLREVTATLNLDRLAELIEAEKPNLADLDCAIDMIAIAIEKHSVQLLDPEWNRVLVYKR